MATTAQSSGRKVVITGGSGLLGRAVMMLFKEKGWETIGTALTRVGPGLVRCDLTDSNSVTELLESQKPALVIHAAAQRFPDKVEKEYEETKKLNIEASGNLGRICQRIGAKLIYLSTDYIFDGVSPPFSHTDEPRPLNKYGETKLEGERALLKEMPSGSVLRIPILYGPVEKLSESAITCLLQLLKDSSPQSISHFEKRYPAHVKDIANMLHDLGCKMLEDEQVCGIYQWSGLEQLTKYDMVVLMSTALGLDHSHISPDDKPVVGASRPVDSRMDNSRLTELGIKYHTTFSNGIKECLSSWL